MVKYQNFLIDVDMKATQARRGMRPVTAVLDRMTYTWSELILSGVGATTHDLNRHNQLLLSSSVLYWQGPSQSLQSLVLVLVLVPVQV